MKRTHIKFKNEYDTAGVLAIAGCFLMVAFPRITQSGVIAGLELFLGSVLPTMLPFFILANFLGSTTVPERIGRLFEPLFQRLFRVGGCGAYVALMSLISGYPMAAKLVGEYCRSGVITALEGKRILAFTSVCGPLFMVGTVGTVMFGSPKRGCLIAMGHYLGAIFNGLIYARFLPVTPTAFGSEILRRKSCEHKKTEDVTLFAAMSEGILRAFASMGLICGYIVLFSVISEFMDQSGFIPSVGKGWFRAMISGAMEMTMGCREVSRTENLSMALRLALCSGLISFGGGSIAGQSLSMLAGSSIGSNDYIRMKLSHGMLAGLITYNLSLWMERSGLFAAVILKYIHIL